MTNLRISLIQSALFWEDKAANLAMFSEKITSIPDKPELILLPEMFTTGFSMNKASLGETMEGPTIAWMKKTAAEKPAILAGSMIARDSGEHAYYNRLVWMLPNGEFGYYDKRHLFAFGDEDEHYRSGNRRLMAMVRRSTRLDGFLMCERPVFSGWKARGMKVWKPPVSSWSSRRRSRWSMRW